MLERASVASAATATWAGYRRAARRTFMATVAGGMLAATAACGDQPHDVTCGAFLRMPGDGQQEVTESFLDDYPIGRTVFGPDGSEQIEAAESALLSYCRQNPDENIKDLEPDLVPGF